MAGSAYPATGAAGLLRPQVDACWGEPFPSASCVCQRRVSPTSCQPSFCGCSPVNICSAAFPSRVRGLGVAVRAVPVAELGADGLKVCEGQCWPGLTRPEEPKK